MPNAGLQRLFAQAPLNDENAQAKSPLQGLVMPRRSIENIAICFNLSAILTILKSM
jgi:hypothetical protein